MPSGQVTGMLLMASEAANLPPMRGKRLYSTRCGPPRARVVLENRLNVG